MTKQCRFGILGTANIARKNWKGIWNAENATLTAVGSRSVERAQEFIGQCQFQVPFDPQPAACGSYDELIARDDVDAVYVPLPTGVRKSVVLKAAEAGKHVICEKPCGANADEVSEMVASCRDRNLQFMDGVMFMHSARLTRMGEILSDGTSVGDLKRIATHHTFRGPPEFFENDIRLNYELEPFGALGDLGWYNIRFILWARKWQLPARVSGRILDAVHRPDSSAPVPVAFSAEMLWDDGVSANFYCSFQTANQQWVSVGGTKGYLRVPDFVLPFHGTELEYSIYNATYEMPSCDFTMHGRVRREWVSEFSESAPNAQETNMFRAFSDKVLSGQREDRWPQMALSTQRVIDACVASAHDEGNLLQM
jgi:predicted dehydrogenase